MVPGAVVASWTALLCLQVLAAGPPVGPDPLPRLQDSARQMHGAQHATQDRQPPSSLRDGITGPIAGASRVPTAAFDATGRLWLTWVESNRVLVSRSDDQGASFSRATVVTPQAEEIDANSESRPKIALGPAGQIYVTFTRLGATPYTGDVRFARSLDGGRSFSEPTTINDDGLAVGHRFDTLAVTSEGLIYVAWIDKRDQEAAAREHRAYEGAALYYTVSRDGGGTFVPNRKLKDGVCECCRLAPAIDRAGRLTLFFRDILPGSIRDHSIATIRPDLSAGPAARATGDGWAIGLCPHHGPSLAIDQAGTYHVVWFTGGGADGPGSFYARSIDHGRTFISPMLLGGKNGQGHAAVLSHEQTVYVVWKEPAQSRGSVVFARQSDDGGISWGSTREIARSQGMSDHPFLVGSNDGVFLSWFSSSEGYRLVPLLAKRSFRSQPRH